MKGLCKLTAFFVNPQLTKVKKTPPSKLKISVLKDEGGGVN